MSAGCDHDWIEVTTHEDSGRRFICAWCEARRSSARDVLRESRFDVPDALLPPELRGPAA